jgi:hypothetical protein
MFLMKLTILMRILLKPTLILWLAASTSVLAQDLIWENQGLTDENTITSGSTFAYNGATVTFTWTVVDDGGFATYPGGSGSTGGGNDYVTYEASQEGGHTGLVLLAFDNAAYDPDDYIQVVLTFSTPQSGLAFSLLDIDSDGWDDNVQLFARPAGGSFVNTVGFPQVWDFAQSNTSLRTVEENDEPLSGWEGTRDRSSPSDNWGNVDLNFEGISIDAIALRFRSTDDFGGRSWRAENWDIGSNRHSGGGNLSGGTGTAGFPGLGAMAAHPEIGPMSYDFLFRRLENSPHRKKWVRYTKVAAILFLILAATAPWIYRESVIHLTVERAKAAAKEGERQQALHWLNATFYRYPHATRLLKPMADFLEILGIPRAIAFREKLVEKKSRRQGIVAGLRRYPVDLSTGCSGSACAGANGKC